jgi:hypothetical protein
LRLLDAEPLSGVRIDLIDPSDCSVRIAVVPLHGLLHVGFVCPLPEDGLTTPENKEGVSYLTKETFLFRLEPVAVDSYVAVVVC